MQQLLDKLNSRDPAVRDTALRNARALPPDELLQLVLLENHNKRTRSRRGWAVYYGVYCLLFTFGAIFFLPPHGLWGFLLVCTSSLVAAGVRDVYTGKYDPARRRISKLLSDTDDVRLVAPMLRLAFAKSEAGEKALRTAIKRLLPQVRADQAPQWSKEDKAALLLPLRQLKKDTDLTLACLKALEQVGDASAIPVVRRLIGKTHSTGSKRKIAQAAQECLLYLESNTGRFQQAETLLRPSENATTHPDILLRPAQPTSGITPTEQLLRSGE